MQGPGRVFPPCALPLTASGKTGPSFGEDSAPSRWKSDFIGEFQGNGAIVGTQGELLPLSPNPWKNWAFL